MVLEQTVFFFVVVVTHITLLLVKSVMQSTGSLHSILIVYSGGAYDVDSPWIIMVIESCFLL